MQTPGPRPRTIASETLGVEAGIRVLTAFHVAQMHLGWRTTTFLIFKRVSILRHTSCHCPGPTFL